MKQVFLLIIIATCSICCEKTIEIQKAFDFDLIMLPVLTEIEPDKPLEMRFTIRSIGGEYIHTRYYARFFLFSGKGILTDENGEMFFPNDDHLLQSKQFRLYYTPSQGTSHRLEIVFFDNFGHEKTVEITFAVPQGEVLQN